MPSRDWDKLRRQDNTKKPELSKPGNGPKFQATVKEVRQWSALQRRSSWERKFRPASSRLPIPPEPKLHSIFLRPAQQRLLAGRATTLSLPTSPLRTLDSTAGRLSAPLKLPQ